MAGSGEARYRLTVDKSDFDKALADASSEWDDFTKALLAGAGIGAAFASGEEVAEKVLGTIKAIPEEVVACVELAAQFAEGMEKASIATGVSTEQLQGLSAAARETNTSFDAIARAVGKLEAAVGSGSKEFEKLGLDLTTLRDESPEDALRQVTGALLDMGNEFDRAEVASKLFGRSWVELLPALKDYLEEADRFVTLSDDQIATMVALHKGTEETKTAWEELRQQFAATLVDASGVDKFFRNLSDGLAAFAKLIKDHQAELTWFFDKIQVIGDIKKFSQLGALAGTAVEEANSYIGSFTPFAKPEAPLPAVKQPIFEPPPQTSFQGPTSAGDYQQNQKMQAEDKAAAEAARAWKDAFRQIVADAQETDRFFKSETQEHVANLLSETNQEINYYVKVDTKFKELQNDETLANKTGLDRRLAEVEIAHQKMLDSVAKETKGHADDYQKLAAQVDRNYADMANHAVESQVEQMEAATKSTLTQSQKAEELRDHMVDQFMQVANSGVATYDQIVRAADAAAKAQKELDKESTLEKLQHFEDIEKAASASLTALFGHSKAAALAGAIADTAAAVISSYLHAGGFPWGIAPAAAMAAAGAAEIAKIRSASYALGTPGLGLVDFGAGTQAVLHGREAVVPENRIGDFANMVAGGDQVPILKQIRDVLTKIHAQGGSGGGSSSGGRGDAGQAVLNLARTGRLRIPATAIVPY